MQIDVVSLSWRSFCACCTSCAACCTLALLTTTQSSTTCSCVDSVTQPAPDLMSFPDFPSFLALLFALLYSTTYRLSKGIGWLFVTVSPSHEAACPSTRVHYLVVLILLLWWRYHVHHGEDIACKNYQLALLFCKNTSSLYIDSLWPQHVA